MASSGEVALARAVLTHGPLSRTALTTHLGLSPASLTRLAKPLLDSGLLVELDDVADGTVGRPSKPLDISPGAGAFAGVKITGGRLFAAAVDVRAEAFATEERDLADHSPDAVADAVAEAVAALGGDGFAGIGVSIGGVMRDGVAEHAPFLGWRDVPFADLLRERLDAPVVVENDLVALVEAERWFGAGRGVPGFVVLTIGAGVGYGLVVEGAPVRTPDAGAGTGGHIPLHDDGPVCELGHRGCAQALLTAGAIAGRVSAARAHPVDYDRALALAAAGDADARAVVDEAGEALGRFIALAANLTLQSSIVLAGEGVGLHDLVADRIDAVVAANRDPFAEPVRVLVDRTGFGSWARGAAVIAIQAAMDRAADGDLSAIARRI